MQRTHTQVNYYKQGAPEIKIVKYKKPVFITQQILGKNSKGAILYLMLNESNCSMGEHLSLTTY